VQAYKNVTEKPLPGGVANRLVADSIEEMEDQSVFWGLETEQLG
jgi:hypothetical protein